ncbi:tetratricopeptide repeat protein [Nonlabens xiamenensis]|uniref:tetratricopeptide repeat protein n=1 Tax=Nonlabens xiamenensis TaxID=2341043 RepID=UPI001F0C499F|nr:tetratricopeptide repeat protein [Nonlabens xiamenensis]
MMKKLLQIVMIGMFALPVFGQDPGSAFAKANKAYAGENYELAIAAYEQVLSMGQHSPEVYFNLGNAYYKTNQVGPSIYYFEKALALAPNDQDIQNNLRYANQMKMDAIQTAPEDVLQSGWDDLVYSLSVDEWAYFSIVLVLVTILMFILYLYAGTVAKKRLFFVLTILGVLTTVFLISMAFYAKSNIDDQEFAIVFQEEVVSREEPKPQATASFVLHEGTKVELLEEFEQWVRISLANGNKAWIPQEAIKKL